MAKRVPRVAAIVHTSYSYKSSRTKKNITSVQPRLMECTTQMFSFPRSESYQRVLSVSFKEVSYSQTPET